LNILVYFGLSEVVILTAVILETSGILTLLFAVPSTLCVGLADNVFAEKNTPHSTTSDAAGSSDSVRKSRENGESTIRKNGKQKHL